MRNFTTFFSMWQSGLTGAIDGLTGALCREALVFKLLYIYFYER